MGCPLERPELNRVFLVYGCVDDMFMSPDLQKSNFRPHLCAYLKDLGYQRIVFYSGARNLGKYVLDDESALLSINKNRHLTAEAQATPVPVPSAQTSQRAQAPSGRKRRIRTPGMGEARPATVVQQREPDAPTASKAPNPASRSRILSPRLADIEARLAEADSTAPAAGQAAPCAEPRPAIGNAMPACAPAPAHKTGALRLTYSQPRITPAEFLDDAKKMMADSSLKTAVVFPFIQDFVSDQSAPLQQYAELLSHLWDEYTLTASQNICIFLAPQMDEASLLELFSRIQNGEVLQSRFFNRNGTINESCSIHVGLPGEDEFRFMLEHLRIVGDSGKRLCYKAGELPGIIAALSYISREADIRDNRQGYLQTVYEDLVRHMRAQPEDTVALTEQLVGDVFRGSGTVYDPDPLRTLTETRGWESVATRVRQIVEDFKRHTAGRASKAVGHDGRIRASERLRHPDGPDTSYPVPHFVIRGNPGVGKTTVARLIGQIFREAGILGKGLTIEATREDLVDRFVGGTAPRTRQKLRESDENVLFVDDAYSLVDRSDSPANYSKEAVDEIVAAMTNPKDSRFCLIMAGYPAPMDELLAMNPGLASRFSSANILTIEDYGPELLKEIFVKDCERDGYSIGLPHADLDLFFFNLHAQRDRASFGNARDVVALAREVKMQSSLRDDRAKTILKEDFGPQARHFAKRGASSIDEIYAQLDQYVGLDFVKDLFDAVQLELQDVRECLERGAVPEQYPDHFIFAGNAGTGKTTVGALMGQFYHQLGALGGSSTIVVDASELIGTHVGDSKDRTLAKIQEAIDHNAVLYVDEAYQIADSAYGSEIIGAMMTRMTENAADFKMIFGMYSSRVEDFLALNPGLARRLRVVDFPDFTPEQLLEILDRAIAGEKCSITDEARRLAGLVLEHLHDTRDSSFGNAGEVRRLLREMKTLRLRRTRGASGEVRYMYTEGDIPEGRLDLIRNKINPRTFDDILADLDEQVGLEDLKDIVRAKREQIDYARLTGRPVGDVLPGYYFFVGSPGTGKSTSARLFAECLHELGIVRTDRFTACTAKDLVGEYVGQSAPKAREILEKSVNGVLFIDEAYGLSYADDPGGGPFKKDALEEVIAFLDVPEHRRRCCVIFAGYEEDMRGLYRSNSGLRSRVEPVHFADFSAGQMVDIFTLFATRNGFSLGDGVAAHYRAMFEAMRGAPYFSNGRTARTVYEKTAANLQRRVVSSRSERDASTFRMEDTLTLPECLEIVSG